jgi:hypothetical protein
VVGVVAGEAREAGAREDEGDLPPRRRGGSGEGDVGQVAEGLAELEPAPAGRERPPQPFEVAAAEGELAGLVEVDGLGQREGDVGQGVVLVGLEKVEEAVEPVGERLAGGGREEDQLVGPFQQVRTGTPVRTGVSRVASSSTTCALMPPKPKALMPARRGWAAGSCIQGRVTGLT